MATYVVECVNVDDGSQYDDCRCIESIGFPAKSGGITTRTPAEVYDWVENDGHTVIVEHDGDETEVVGVLDGTTKYVRTEPNDTKDDNLLKQPSC
jgi:hypothetical protein